MSDRYPNLPLEPFTDEERWNQCVLCGMPELHRRTHRPSVLHGTREMAVRYAAYQDVRVLSVEDTLRVIRKQRPELLRQPVEPVCRDRGEQEADLLTEDF